tara:strand:+ start:214 stop:1374 length:1161 start_codon:yes stop_codon:yes gene_type:complete
MGLNAVVLLQSFALSLGVYIFLKVNAQNYRYLIILSGLKIVLIYILMRQIVIFDLVAGGNDLSLTAGRGMDWQFLLPTAIVAMTVLYLRFPVVLAINVSILLIFAVELFLYFQINPFVYFTGDFEKIVSDPNAVNRTIFIANMQGILLAAVVAISVSFFIEKLMDNVARSEKTASQLGRYFSPEIRKEISRDDFDISTQNPKDLDIAVMFTDIVGFTKLSESMPPREVLKLLSEYQTLMVDAIFQHKGSVDKFIGDAVMANFGTPKSHGNDAQNAFNCALEMERQLSSWNKVRYQNGFEKIEHRIGIHFGQCVVGNMGSNERTEFAVIGDVVNVASRICDACKQFDTNFLVSSNLAERVETNKRFEIVKDFEIRGRSEKLELIKVY